MTRTSPDETTHDANKAYRIVPRWIDTSGRTRTWTLLSPAGDRIADTTTKQGASNLVHLLRLAEGITWKLDSVATAANQGITP